MGATEHDSGVTKAETFATSNVSGEADVRNIDAEIRMADSIVKRHYGNLIPDFLCWT
jgi:hypothetical protein